MNSHSYIACDLGAESGRVILGTLQNGRLTLEEIHRFPTGPVHVNESMHWDVARIFQELKTGLTQVAEHLEATGMGHAESLSVDSWGVDYVLVNGANESVAPAYHYRDPRTGAAFEATLKAVPAETIFAETGIQFMSINTLYQLIAHGQQEPGHLEQADQLLLIADYFHALFSGVSRAERSGASTTQLYNPTTREWSEELQTRFALPKNLFPPLVDSGTVLGPLKPEVAAETGLRGVQVIATCSHDTAAAVAAVPEEGDDWAYLSSGTWSLVGVELPEPLINAQVQAANFTNEIGYGGTVRFLKNIAGLWIVQECRRAWQAKGKDYTYDELIRMAESAPPFGSLLQPADARFLSPGGMPGKVREFCRSTGQEIPETPGQIIRCALESLALSYRETLEQIEALTGRSISRLHIVGGGSRNALLNQFAAGATGRDVLAGPVEATAIGNLLLQALTLGHLGTLADLRKTVLTSFPVQSYTPSDADAWQNAYTKFQQMETTNT
ncbi:MAG: rhamnulokinase [Janthinobacterium lividum]